MLFQTTMRRNLTSLFKFTLICALAVLLTIFVYRTLFFMHHRYDDNSKSIASERRMHPRQGAFFGGSDKNAKVIKIDWHDYTFIEDEKLRTGLGEHGDAAFLSSGLDDERKRLFDQNGFNALLSDKIALNRSVKDIRHEEYAIRDCKRFSINFNQYSSLFCRSMFLVAIN